jgi:Zn-dependent protease
MSEQAIVLKIFEYAILLFALSLHEASHAWMASRLGDQTARMLGRVTLNPTKHIDPLGTMLIPLLMLFMPGYGQFLIGWAKPTPVNTRNFKKITRDDILTTLAGPCSNLAAAIVCLVLLVLLAKLSPIGNNVVHQLAGGMLDPTLIGSSGIFPLAMLFYMGVVLNLFLTVFNLLPIPPLDGSHVLRHMLPYKALRVYDSLGILSLILILFVGARLMNFFVAPALALVNGILLSV